MDFSRRSFLVGTGAVITTPFVRTARVFARNKGEPFLLSEASAPQVLYASRTFNDEFPERFFLTMGKPQYEPTYTPTWGEFFALEGEDVDDPACWTRLSESGEITRTDLSRPMDEYRWSCSWSCRYGPDARAVHFLHDLELDRYVGNQRMLGGLDFVEGQYPGSWDRWVEAEDALSVSLIQARLRELRVPVEVRLGEME